jgi:hypothetical protein
MGRGRGGTRCCRAQTCTATWTSCPRVAGLPPFLLPPDAATAAATAFCAARWLDLSVFLALALRARAALADACTVFMCTALALFS